MIFNHPITLVVLLTLVILGLTSYIILITSLIPNNHNTTNNILYPHLFRHYQYTKGNGNYAKLDHSHKLDNCEGKYVYIYKLPHEFNEDLVDKCGRLTNNWFPLCGTLTHHGYGPKVNLTGFEENQTLVPSHAWYRSEQFSLELIFHHRMKSYACLTSDPTHARLFFIPYYGALDTAFTLFSPNLHRRDQLAHSLVGWLSGNPTWVEFKGQRRHFMVLGRVSWDFSRNEEESSYNRSNNGWGSSLLAQVELSNVTKLLIERRTWHHDEMAIPYPTSFHPSSYQDVKLWQEKLAKYVGTKKRRWLCSFIGSKSRGTQVSRELRAEISRQCEKARPHMCRQVTCIEGVGSYDGAIDCTKRPDQVTSLFLNSAFCLQPPGDSWTRKSLFDSLVSGCIPVLFSPLSAYDQYKWHLPRNPNIYSLMFDASEVTQGRVHIVASLERIARDTIRLHQMQLSIIKMLPRIVYAMPGPDKQALGFRDVVDIALERLLDTSSEL